MLFNLCKCNLSFKLIFILEVGYIHSDKKQRWRGRRTWEIDAKMQQKICLPNWHVCLFKLNSIVPLDGMQTSKISAKYFSPFASIELSQVRKTTKDSQRYSDIKTTRGGVEGEELIFERFLSPMFVYEHWLFWPVEKQIDSAMPQWTKAFSLKVSTLSVLNNVDQLLQGEF